MARVDFSEVRQLYTNGLKQREIAAKFGISRGYVSDIVCGRTGWTEDSEATVQGLRDSRNLTRRRLRESLKAEDLFNHLAEVTAEYITPVKLPCPPKIAQRKDVVEETAVLVLSDGHHDQVVTPGEVGDLEDHNFLVAVRRGQYLVDTVRKFCTSTLKGYRFDKLVVLCLGDATGGEIHEAEQRSHYRNQFINSVAISQLYTRMLSDLAGSFPQIETHWVAGNHGRRTTKKQYAGGPLNNWDSLIARMTEAYLGHNPGISFNIPNSWSAVVDVEGYGCHISHGDDVSNSGSNPWLGLRKRHERQSPINRGQRIDAYFIGHHHTPGIVAGNGVTYVCNGAWVGTDQFAYNCLGVGGTPTQYLLGVNKKRGLTWQLPLQIAGAHDHKPSPYDSIAEEAANG